LQLHCKIKLGIFLLALLNCHASQQVAKVTLNEWQSIPRVRLLSQSKNTSQRNDPFQARTIDKAGLAIF